MTLLEILVSELPRRGGWPGEAVAISAGSNNAVYAHERIPNRIISGVWTDENEDTFGKYGRIFFLDESPDYREKPVTREQYEAVLAAKNEGWIDWGGGECPVSASEMVDVIFGHGGRMSTNIADCWRWNHSGTSSDIIAYRPHKPLEQQLPSEEVPIWNGEGLPPLGCECQYRKHKKSEQSEWFNGVVKYASEFTVVIQPACYAGETIGHPDNFEFRTIPSEDDIKRDASIKAIFDVLAQYDSLKGCHTYEGKADYIYSAIASGKIPHISIDHTAE
ncbi:hypothetical protein P7S38_002492 [Klebsiella variicola]|nr:hypothetical protein [Klebsiella variicola]